MMSIDHSKHSMFRSAQRALTDDQLEYVYQFGHRYHAGGALIYFLRRRDVPPPDLRNEFAIHLVGTALVVALNGRHLITTWRNPRNGLKIIRKKMIRHGRTHAGKRTVL